MGPDINISIHAPREGCDPCTFCRAAVSPALFQSTHPARGATASVANGGWWPAISIHTPREGCDHPASLIPFRSIDFNPHTPRGVRPRRSSAGGAILPFQSTHPARGATVVSDGHLVPARTFQSTHPARGATPHQSRRLLGPRHISIHAPREGCDGAAVSASAWVWIFQSTHPARGATRPRSEERGRAGISIHAPREGCDPWRMPTLADEKVFQSTHPARGATPGRQSARPELRYFNPRTPRGVRHQAIADKYTAMSISIHAPREGCDSRRHPQSGAIPISIHAPREGCDSESLQRAWSVVISIHAPREGCDLFHLSFGRSQLDFNPRTPRGVRPVWSISHSCWSQFQSTHPARGATRSLYNGLGVW